MKSMSIPIGPVESEHGVDVAIEVRTARKVYGGGRRRSYEALADVSLEVRRGEMLVLLGPSGCGKTTLLRCIAGLEDLTAGVISVDGRVVSDPAQRTNVAPNKRDIGFVFQSYALWPHMRVRANVAYPLRSRGMKRQMANAEAARVLESLDCGDLLDRYPAELSGGQQQRVALARSLVGGARLILFDEPLSNIDAQLRHQVRSEIRRLHVEYDFTGIYVTHDQREAIELGDRIAVMRAGRIAQIDTPDGIYRSPADPETAKFVGMENLLTCTVSSTGEVGTDAGPLQGHVGDLFGDVATPGRFSLFLRGSSLKVCRQSKWASDAGGDDRYCMLYGGRVADVVFGGETRWIVVNVGQARLTATFDPNQQSPDIGDWVTCFFCPGEALVYGVEEHDADAMS